MSSGPQPKRLGAFLGVFTPTVLTILGVILFLRTGWLVGVSGVWGALLIVVVANLITLLTAMSVSALATNMRVGVGGAYFIISRSLGLEVGGAVGIPLYLSQVLSITLYSYGLAESLNYIWPATLPPLNLTVVASVIVIGVTMVAAKSTELTLRLQLPVMGLIAAAILSLFLGVEWGPIQTQGFGPFEEPGQSIGFWGAFAVFFPAVTGILAGVSLSGDLADPGRSIPVGVLSAVVVGFVVYLIVPVGLAMSADTTTLLNDKMIWTSLAVAPWLVLPGLWGAILSSAFGSALGAPRTLQALASDDLVPSSLGRVDEKTGEPVFGLRLSGALALGASLVLGDLNTVAEWVTIFFLTTYGTLNLVAVIEILVADPSYRPRIRIPWWAAALGGIGCFVAMFAINPLACAVAIGIEMLIWLAIRRRALEAGFGDARNSIMLSLVHALIVWFTSAKKDARGWRPHILVLTEDLQADRRSVRLASQVGETQGVLTVVEVVETPLEALVPEDPSKIESLRSAGIDAFYETAQVPRIDDAALIGVAQAHGFGALNANTVLYAWDGEADSLAVMLRRSRHLSKLQKCTLVHRCRDDAPHVAGFLDKPVIMVWWKGLDINGDLMLLLAYLLTRSPDWHDAQIQLRTVASTAGDAASWRESVQKMVGDSRLPVEVVADVVEDPSQVVQTIVEASQGAKLVLMGMPHVQAGDEPRMALGLMPLLENLPEVMLVRNDGPYRGMLL